MKKIKVSLVDSDYVVHAITELPAEDDKNTFANLIQHLDEDFIHGDKAFLEIEGLEKGPIRLEVSQHDEYYLNRNYSA